MDMRQLRESAIVIWPAYGICELQSFCDHYQTKRAIVFARPGPLPTSLAGAYTKAGPSVVLLCMYLGILLGSR